MGRTNCAYLVPTPASPAPQLRSTASPVTQPYAFYPQIGAPALSTTTTTMLLLHVRNAIILAVLVFTETTARHATHRTIASLTQSTNTAYAPLATTMMV